MSGIYGTVRGCERRESGMRMRLLRKIEIKINKIY